MIPSVSRQIAFVQYDDQSSSMTVQYHTGFRASYTNVKQDELSFGIHIGQSVRLFNETYGKPVHGGQHFNEVKISK